VLDHTQTIYFFHMSEWNFCCLSLQKLPLYPSLDITKMTVAQSSYSSHQVFADISKILHCKEPFLLFFLSYEGWSSSFIIFVALCWNHPVCLCLSCTGEPRTGPSTPDGSYKGWEEREASVFDLLEMFFVVHLRRLLTIFCLLRTL